MRTGFLLRSPPLQVHMRNVHRTRINSRVAIARNLSVWRCIVNVSWVALSAIKIVSVLAAITLSFSPKYVEWWMKRVNSGKSRTKIEGAIVRNLIVSKNIASVLMLESTVAVFASVNNARMSNIQGNLLPRRKWWTSNSWINLTHYYYQFQTNTDRVCWSSSTIY